MAFVQQSSIPPEQQNQYGQVGQTRPNPLALLPPQAGGSTGQGVGAGGPAPTQPSSTQFGSNASKLSDYLSANKDQIQAQGSKIAGDLGTQFGQVQSDINQAAQGVSGQVNAGYAPLNQGVISAAAADPTGFAADPNNVKAF